MDPVVIVVGARAPGRPKPGSATSGGRPTYPADGGLQ